MRTIGHLLFTAVAVHGLAVGAQAAPTITPLGNYELLPNTPGQKIPLYVTGIVPNAGPNRPFFDGNVNGMLLTVAISEGGVGYPQYVGTPGPVITSIDVDSGPTIWVAPNSPAGHNVPYEEYPGQIAHIQFLTVSGWVNVPGGLLATLVIDTTGFDSGTYPLTLRGDVNEEFQGNSIIIGYFGEGVDGTISYDGPAGQITIVPEPSSVVLATIGLIGLAAWGWRWTRAR